MALPAETRRNKLLGSPTPRIAPPVPSKTAVRDFDAAATSLGINLFPWQKTVGKYLYALGPRDQWLWPEVAVIVARQQGKTSLLLPHILHRMTMGRRVLHAANHRDLPRTSVFTKLVDIVLDRFPGAVIRRAAGSESIELKNGGAYRISAASSGGPRGWSVDDLIVDEVREINDDFIQAATPTVSASSKPQMLWLSNAGSDESTALNAIRLRGTEGDPALAYLEWSTPSEYTADDPAGWLYSNPSIGHLPQMLNSIEQAYRSHKMSGTLSAFETERLCRWVATMRERLVDDYSWVRCKADTGLPLRPVIAVSMDPKGRRASVALAWSVDGTVALRLLLNVTGDPIDTDALGREVKALAQKYGAKQVGHDPLSDKELVKYVKTGKPVSGQEFANASAQFANIVTAGRLRWEDCDAVTDDLTWTASKPNGEGSYHAVRALDDRPITASLAAIRAVWLASGPPVPVARVWT